MARSERTEAEWFFTGATLCILLAIAGFRYGISSFASAPFATLLVWGLSLVFLYIVWTFAVDELVLIVRIATSE